MLVSNVGFIKTHGLNEGQKGKAVYLNKTW